MKINRIMSIAAAGALLLTGCSVKRKSSSSAFITGEPEYTSDEFDSYSTEYFTFKTNADFKVSDTRYDEDKGSGLNLTTYKLYDEEVPLSIIVYDKIYEKEPVLEEKEAIEEISKYYKEASLGGDIRSEHSSHDHIYTYIIDSSAGDISTAVAVASKDGHSLVIMARNYFTKDSGKILPIIKDIAESTEYIP